MNKLFNVIINYSKSFSVRNSYNTNIDCSCGYFLISDTNTDETTKTSFRLFLLSRFVF